MIRYKLLVSVLMFFVFAHAVIEISRDQPNIRQNIVSYNSDNSEYLDFYMLPNVPQSLLSLFRVWYKHYSTGYLDISIEITTISFRQMSL